MNTRKNKKPFALKIRFALSFLTRYPVGKLPYEEEAFYRSASYFPLTGLFIGIPLCFLAFLLRTLLDSDLLGFLLLGILIWLTGGHHSDGLMDFGDGIMVTGDAKKRIEVMHDVHVGTGGILLVFFTYILTAKMLGQLVSLFPWIILLSEILCRFTMVTSLTFGTSADTPMAKKFIEKTTKREFFIATFITMALTVSVLMTYKTLGGTLLSLGENRDSLSFSDIFTDLKNPFLGAFLFLVLSLIPSFFMNRFADKKFGGLTGDCLGALNELSRLYLLFIFLLLQETLGLTQIL